MEQYIKQYIKGLFFMVLAAIFIVLIEPEKFSIGGVIFYAANVILATIMTYEIMDMDNAL